MKNLNKEFLGEHQILTKTEMQNVSLGGNVPKEDDCITDGGRRLLGEVCRNERVTNGICKYPDGFSPFTCIPNEW